MGDFVNRTTLQVVQSGNDPDYPDPPWMFLDRTASNAANAIDRKYRKMDGDAVVEMTAGEKAAVDSARETSNRDATVAEIDEVENLLRAFMLVVLDEVNVLRTRAVLPERTVAQMRTAIRNKLGS